MKVTGVLLMALLINALLFWVIAWLGGGLATHYKIRNVCQRDGYFELSKIDRIKCSVEVKDWPK